MARKTVTLRDLASLGGVSVSTVSRALADDARISPERRQQIAELVERTGYRPQPMRRGRKDAIALLIATPTPGQVDDDYQTRLAGMISRHAEEVGYHLHLRLIARDDTSGALPPIVHEQRVDGVILSGHPPALLCRTLREHRVPAVVVDDSRERTGLCSVRGDYSRVLPDIVARLTALGHRRFGFCATQRRWPSVDARCRAFLACAEGDVVEDLTPDMRGGREGLRRLLAEAVPPTAMLFVNDWMALGALLEAARLGIDVPGRLSLIGFDNMPMGNDCEPRLSSVDLCIDGLAREAIRMLDEQVEQYHTPQDVVLGCVPVWRDSTGPAPAPSTRITP